MKSHILITGKLHPLALRLFEEAKDVEVAYHPDISTAEILTLIAQAHALVSRSETDVTRELIDRAPHLKVIARAAVGIGNIDVDYATDKGILVINTPGKNTNSAAELAFGLLLAAVRKIVPAHGHMLEQRWDRHRFTGTELLGKTIGIIGLGNVGHRVARFARAFDMTVLAYDPYIADEVFESHGARKVAFETLLAESDIVTIHTPKTRETTDMIAAPQLAAMKKGVILINAARGGLYNEADLLAALKSGQVAAAGIDTWDHEPPKDNPFRLLPNVVMTPHIGASTEEAQVRVAESIADQTLRAVRDEVVDYPVNMPQVRVITSPRVKTYTVLAERLGMFAMQSLDFNPNLVKILYRGELKVEEGGMIRRAFLKGFLKNTAEEAISFVNAERKAAERGIQVVETDDPAFRDYQSAVKFTVSHGAQQFVIGGVVFGENNYRLSLVNEWTFEVIPSGELLSILNVDRPGVIGQVGTILSEHRINISQFELSRNMPGGQAMSLIRVDQPVDGAVLEALRSLPNVVSVRRIVV
ncbi:MAG: phosphoglycerate dehydrogenase [Candidatus Lambdaproteobacteria bacterium]|nr:phosphoglycerate dehydrogenase [Candidatus Lambdaproteobacteria bacterium]